MSERQKNQTLLLPNRVRRKRRDMHRVIMFLGICGSLAASLGDYYIKPEHLELLGDWRVLASVGFFALSIRSMLLSWDYDEHLPEDAEDDDEFDEERGL